MSVTYQISKFKTKDCVNLSYTKWWGVKTAKSVAVYLHGLESHKAWFDQAANCLAQEDIVVYTLDRRGAGESEGLLGHVEDYRVLINDVFDFIKFVKEEYPNVALYIIGLCWGAKLACVVSGFNSINHGNLVDGLVLLSPGIYTRVNLSFLEKLKVLVLNLFAPKTLVSTIVKDEMFTDNRKYLEYIKEDQRRLHHVTARFYWETALLDRCLSKVTKKIDVPVFVLLAGKDTVVNNHAVKKWVSRLNVVSKECKVYPDSCHTLFFAQAEFKVIEDIKRWIEQTTLNLELKGKG